MRNIIYSTIIIIMLIIVSFTSYKVIKEHNAKLLIVSEKRIIEAAKECINEKKCDKYPITLNTLYSLNYLEKEANPITKEYYNENSYIDMKNNNYSFVVVD